MVQQGKGQWVGRLVEAAQVSEFWLFVDELCVQKAADCFLLWWWDGRCFSLHLSLEWLIATPATSDIDLSVSFLVSPAVQWNRPSRLLCEPARTRRNSVVIIIMLYDLVKEGTDASLQMLQLKYKQPNTTNNITTTPAPPTTISRCHLISPTTP